MASAHRLARLTGITACSITLAFAFHSLSSGAGAPATAQWSVGRVNTDPLAKVQPDTTIECRLELKEPAFVYAVSFDSTRGCHALVPSGQLLSDLEDGRWSVREHALPGSHMSKSLTWSSGDAEGPISFVLLVCASRQPELEAAMNKMEQVGNAAFPTRSMLAPYAPEGGMDVTPPRHALPPGAFGRAFSQIGDHHDGELKKVGDGIWASVLRLDVATAAPPRGDANDRAKRMLEDRLGDLVVKPPGTRK